MVETLFWGCFCYLAYVYVLLPVGLAALALVARPRFESGWGYGLPDVSVVVTFGSPDAAAIRERVADVRANGYPADRLEIVVVCDGPLEGLKDLQAELDGGPARVVLLELQARLGKTAAQNVGASHATGRVLVFTDADTKLGHGSIEAVVRPLGDPDVGCACGRLVYRDSSLEGAYWAYETLMKAAEAKVHSLLGASGALYAIRRADYAELPPWALSDFVEPIYQLINGRRTCWVPEAVAWERVPASPGETFTRKRRITLRALSSLVLILPVLNFKARPATAWLFTSHKLMRWLSWAPLLGLYFTSFVLSEDPYYARFAAAQMVFYLYGAGVYFGFPGAGVPAYIVEVASAQLVACVQWLFGRRQTVWEPSAAALARGA